MLQYSEIVFIICTYIVSLIAYLRNSFFGQIELLASLYSPITVVSPCITSYEKDMKRYAIKLTISYVLYFHVLCYWNTSNVLLCFPVVKETLLLSWATEVEHFPSSALTLIKWQTDKRKCRHLKRHIFFFVMFLDLTSSQIIYQKIKQSPINCKYMHGPSLSLYIRRHTFYSPHMKLLMPVYMYI